MEQEDIMKHKYLDSSFEHLKNEYSIDAVKDVILIHEDKIYAYLKTDEEPLSFHVISGSLSTIGFENKPFITIKEIFNRFDHNSLYAEVAGKVEYYESNYRICTDLSQDTTISIPLLKGNERFWLRIERVRLDSNDKIQAVFISNSTKYITEEERMFNKTHRDSLTQVFNRYTLDYHYGERYYFGKFHTLYLDLDNFKQANDQFGHDVGNKYLQKFGQILLSYENDYNRFYRIGGDEFVGMFFEPEETVRKIAQESINKAYDLSKELQNLGTTVSIGIIKATIREDVIRKADEVLYDVKTSGKNAYKYVVEE